MPKLSTQEICARIKVGERFVKPFAVNDRAASGKYRDAANITGYIPVDDGSTDEDGGDVPVSVAVGQSNLLATNIITKVASVAIGNPDWHVKTMEATPQQPVPEDAANIVRVFMQAKWRLYNWVKIAQKTLTKRYVAGMGVMAYRWDEKTRSTFEHVQSWDLAIDPNVRDWRDLDWAARKIKMSLRKAKERYPKAEFRNLTEGTAAADTDKIEIWIYWDKESECHIWDNDIIESAPNLYKAVPLLFLEGDIDPGPSVWPLSDFHLAEGLQAELSDINQGISNSAKHGGVINFYDSGALESAGREALEAGKSQAYIPAKDLLNPPVVRIPAEQLSPTMLEAKREAQQSLDAITGVNQFQRGVINQGAKFATEVALVGTQSGSRGIQARIEYELFLNRMAETVIMLEREFGGHDEAHPEDSTDELLILLECMSAVTEIVVLESSTTYKDPAAELQMAMQRVNLVAGLFPLLAQTGQAVPNIKQYVDDVLRLSGKNETERYWQAPPPPPIMPGQPTGGSGSLPPGNQPKLGS